MSIDKRKSSLEKNVSSEVIDQFNTIVNKCEAIGGITLALTSMALTYVKNDADNYEKICTVTIVGIVGGIVGYVIGYCVGRMIASSYLQRKYPTKAGWLKEWERSTRGLFK